MKVVVVSGARSRGAGVAAMVGVVASPYGPTTLHRSSDVADADPLPVILGALGRPARTLPIVFSMHTGTRERARAFCRQALLQPPVVSEPLGHVEMLGRHDSAVVVSAESGGIESESSVFGVPHLRLPEATRRPVTVIRGANTLINWLPTDPGNREPARARSQLVVGERAPERRDGRTGERVVAALRNTTGLSS